MQPSKTTSSTIDLILTAAERVALRDGVLRLTVEAVAREAKLSKGGVLYHFATKESLIQAMLDRLIRYCEQEIAQHQQNDTAPGRWTRAYVRKTLAPLTSYPGEAAFPKSKEVGAGLIAYVSGFAPGNGPLNVMGLVPRAPRSFVWRWTACGWPMCWASGR